MHETWVKAGYAVFDLGDGSWGWTERGKKLPNEIRHTLSNLLYGGSIHKLDAKRLTRMLAEHGFNEHGFYLFDEQHKNGG